MRIDGRQAAVAVVVLLLATAGAQAGTVTVEMESLTPKTSAGAVEVQDMASFGSAWGGGAQLLWHPPAPVDQPIRNWPNLTAYLTVPTADRYEVTVFLTGAPDYGKVRLFVDGSARYDYDGYAPAVVRRDVRIGALTLAAGSHQLVFTVFGKAAASSGFLVGLDRVELRGSSEAAPPQGSVGLHQLERPPTLRLPEESKVAPADGDWRRRMLREKDASTVTGRPVVLSVERLSQPGVAHLDLRLCDYVSSEPARIVMRGLRRGEPLGGEARLSLQTTPGLVYLVSFSVARGSIRSPEGLGTFEARVEIGKDVVQTTTTLQGKAAEGETGEVAIAFKAQAREAQVTLRRVEPGPDYELRQVEITTAR
jgi:hypothetical protein